MEIFDTDYKVMCVDDDPIQIIVYQSIFEKVQAQVDFFGDSAEAIEATRKVNYDLIVTDLNMPVDNGIDVFVKTKEIYSGRGVKPPKYILVTGYEGQISSFGGIDPHDIAVIYKSIGFDLYFRKPISYSEFFEAALYLVTTDLP